MPEGGCVSWMCQSAVRPQLAAAGGTDGHLCPSSCFASPYRDAIHITERNYRKVYAITISTPKKPAKRLSMSGTGTEKLPASRQSGGRGSGT